MLSNIGLAHPDIRNGGIITSAYVNLRIHMFVRSSYHIIITYYLISCPCCTSSDDLLRCIPICAGVHADVFVFSQLFL